MHEGEGMWKCQESRETIRKEVRSTSPGHCHQYTNMCLCFWPVNKEKKTRLDSIVLTCYHPGPPKHCLNLLSPKPLFPFSLEPILKRLSSPLLPSSSCQGHENFSLSRPNDQFSVFVSPQLPAALITADRSHPWLHSLHQALRMPTVLFPPVFLALLPLSLMGSSSSTTSPCGSGPRLWPGSSFLVTLTSGVISITHSALNFFCCWRLANLNLSTLSLDLSSEV